MPHVSSAAPVPPARPDNFNLKGLPLSRSPPCTPSKDGVEFPFPSRGVCLSRGLWITDARCSKSAQGRTTSARRCPHNRLRRCTKGRGTASPLRLPGDTLRDPPAAALRPYRPARIKSRLPTSLDRELPRLRCYPTSHGRSLPGASSLGSQGRLAPCVPSMPSRCHARLLATRACIGRQQATIVPPPGVVSGLGQ